MNYFEGNNSTFIQNPIFNGEPVKVEMYWRYMLVSRCVADKTHC